MSQPAPVAAPGIPASMDTADRLTASGAAPAWAWRRRTVLVLALGLLGGAAATAAGTPAGHGDTVAKTLIKVEETGTF